MTRRRGRTPVQVWGAGVALLVVAAACTSNSTGATTSPPASPTSPASAGPSSAVSPVADAQEDALATWANFWDVWARERAAEEPDLSSLEEIASADVVQQFEDQLELDRGSGFRVATEVESYPDVVEHVGDRALIAACTVTEETSEPEGGGAPVLQTFRRYYEAELRKDSDHWIVASLAPDASREDCIPAELEREVVAAYEAFWNALFTAADPPDPGHPQVSGTMAGEQHEVVVSLLSDLRDRGAALRGRPETHAEMIDLGIGRAVVRDCQLIPQDHGVYDLESGERQDDIPPVEPGQRDIRSAHLERTAGGWKVIELDGQTDVSCEFTS